MAKPRLGIRRSNTQWEKLIVEGLHVDECLDWIIQDLTKNQGSNCLLENAIGGRHDELYKYAN